MTTRSAFLVSLLAGTCALTSACGGTAGSSTTSSGKTTSSAAPRIDAERVEALIADGIERDLEVQVAVACPDDVERAVGATFDCEAALPEDDETTFDVEAEQTSDDGNVSWNLRARRSDDIEQQMAAKILRERDIKVTVECPALYALEAGSTFNCVARDGAGDEQEIEVEQVDAKGNVEWRT